MLRLLLMHAGGLSLQPTVQRACRQGLGRLSAVADEVLLADRAYAPREAVGALLDQGVKVVVRLNGRNFPPLSSPEGNPVELLAQLRTPQVGQVKDWQLYFRFGERCWPIRLCAVRKSRAAGGLAGNARLSAQGAAVPVVAAGVNSARGAVAGALHGSSAGASAAAGTRN